MTKAAAIIEPRVIHPQAGAIDIRGDVNGNAESALMDAYVNLCSQGVKGVILNFDGLNYMNSSGIGLLVTLLIRAARDGKRLLAWGLSDHYREIFHVTRLDEAIALYDSEEKALSAL